VTAWLIALVWPIYLTLAMFAPVFARVFGASFAAGSTALMIAALAGLFGLATGPVTGVLLMAGRGGWNLANAVASLALNVSLNVVLIPHLGVTGAGVAAASSLVAFNLAALIQVRLLEGLTPFGRETFVAAAVTSACFGAISGIVRAALGPTIAGLLAAIGVALPIYCVLIWRLREPLHLEAIRQAVGGLAERSVAPARPARGGRDRRRTPRPLSD
jgi:O-antigen/teichoic acid export membrane protein